MSYASAYVRRNELTAMLELDALLDDWAIPDPEGAPMSTEAVTEHAIRMSGGSMQVRPNDSHIERIYPLDQWIPDQQRFGGKVYRRTVIVVEDWTEVER